jgi:hypothetical protein
MDNEYQIEPFGKKFRVIDPEGEYLVDVFPSEAAAKLEIEGCKKEDVLWQSARLLVAKAKTTLMTKHDVDSNIARSLIRDAAEVC